MKTKQPSRDQGKKPKLAECISNDHLNSAEKSPIQKPSLMPNMHFNYFFSWNTIEVIEQKIINYIYFIQKNYTEIKGFYCYESSIILF